MLISCLAASSTVIGRVLTMLISLGGIEVLSSVSFWVVVQWWILAVATLAAGDLMNFRKLQATQGDLAGKFHVVQSCSKVLS